MRALLDTFASLPGLILRGVETAAANPGPVVAVGVLAALCAVSVAVNLASWRGGHQ